ncbi:MAG: hypothetical protein ACKVUS_16985 [Saprospiraceae bacterium]
MQAVFTIPASEFDSSLFEKIKNLLKANGEGAEVVISVRTKARYIEDLKKSIAEADADEDCTVFTVEEFESFYKPQVVSQ